MLAGPIFAREATLTPRRPRHFVYLTVYTTALLIVMCTAWLVVAGTQVIRNVGDMARFGTLLFQLLAPLQAALVVFLSALVAAGAVAQEKDRRTLILLLMTTISNTELVVGKLLSSLLGVFSMLAAALPVFGLLTVLGGVSWEQVARVYAVTIVTGIVTGSLGTMFAFWREKTFQTLAMTALTLVTWLAVLEAIDLLVPHLHGVVHSLSPLRAILAAARPLLTTGSIWSDEVGAFLAAGIAASIAINLWTIARVRVWNPSRDVRRGQKESVEQESIWGVEHDLAEAARTGHVDGRRDRASGRSRIVWTNPVLWREICTWAYGRKVLVMRAAYVLLFVLAAAALQGASANARGASRDAETVLPAAAKPVAPFLLVSLVIINALAVTSVTNERDGQAIDLLLVTDISPREFVFGKLGGVLWVTKEMVLLPLALCLWLWGTGGIRGENLAYLLGGLAVMIVFVTTLGIHCGMNYANSRTAITVSLGTVFFLFLGVVTCLLMMISFSGSFQTQFLPFSAFILGGSLGLYVSLGLRNPSPAIQAASLLLPFATFFAITSFILGGRELTVFLVTAATYGFTTAALLVPAIHEFDIAMGRTKLGGEE